MKKLLQLLTPISRKISSFFNRKQHWRSPLEFDPAPLQTAFESNLEALDHLAAQHGISTHIQAKQGIVDGQNGVYTHPGGISRTEESITHNGQRTKGQATLHSQESGRLHRNSITKAQQASQDPAILADLKQEILNEKERALAKASRNTSGAGIPWRLRIKWRSVAGLLMVLFGLKRYWEEIFKQTDAQYQQQVAGYQHLPPVRGLIDSLYFTWGIIVVLTGAEIYVNFAAFQNIGAGSTGLSNLIIGFACAIGQALAAKSLGTALCQKKRGRVWLFAVFTIFTVCAVSVSRIMMKGVPDITKVFYFIVNIGFAAFTLILAHFHARHREFFSLQQKRKCAAERIDRISHWIKQLGLVNEKRHSIIERDYRHLIQMLEYDHQQWCNAQIEFHESCLKQLEAHEQLTCQNIDTATQHALGEYRRFNDEARRQYGLHAGNHPHIAPPDGNKTDQGTLGHAAAILLLLVAGLAGCQSPLPETHLEVIVDRTNPMTVQDVEPFLDYVQGFVITDTLQDEWGEATVNLSTIGDVSVEPVISLHLTSSGSVWFRNEQEHKQNIARFRSDLRQALVTLTQPGTGMDLSFIHRNIQSRLNDLKKYPGRKIVLCWSDLILNEPEVNFYLYEEHPEQIMLHKEELISAMTKDYPISGVNGVRIINIYQPSTKDDRLREAATRYFGGYWTGLGMEVEFISNIPFTPPKLVASDQKIAK